MVDNKVTIAVLSGKGGTGKTFVAVNLASVIEKSYYIDCDVEEPNGHLFFKPAQIVSSEVTVKVPVVDPNLCNGCRQCISVCKFNALAFIGGKVKVFDAICHSCAGCALLCPTGAITEVDRIIGHVETGESQGISCRTGFLNPGEASGVPVIQSVMLNPTTNDPIRLIDCPPGSACVVMESVKEADYCLLVAEPTRFGVHNLSMVHELVTLMNKPFAVILNKCTEGLNPSKAYCDAHHIDVLMEIPYDAEVGTLNAQGRIVARELPVYKQAFLELWGKIKKVVDQ